METVPTLTEATTALVTVAGVGQTVMKTSMNVISFHVKMEGPATTPWEAFSATVRLHGQTATVTQISMSA